LAQKLDSERIYEKLQPAIVQVRNGELTASGVLISQDGLLLTTYQMALSPLPLSVRAHITSQNGSTVAQFDQVELQAVHPAHNVACFKIIAADQSFTPAPISDRAPKVGSEVLLLGAQSTENADFSVQIREGIVSASERTLKDRVYLEIAIASNPEDAGSIIVDKGARIIGMVSSHNPQNEGIAFAIPAQELDLQRMGSSKERQIDKQRAEEWSQQAKEMAVMSRRVREEEERELLRDAAEYCFRQAILNDPLAAVHYYDLGILYQHQNQLSTALAYVQRVDQLVPDNAQAQYTLGEIFESLGQKSLSEELWLRGIALKPVEGASKCALKYAATCRERGDQLEAYWYSALSKVLSPETSEFEMLIREEFAPKVSRAVSAEIRSLLRPEDFSQEKLAFLQALQKATYPLEAEEFAQFREEYQVEDEAVHAVKKGKENAKLRAGGVTLRLPGQLRRSRSAYNGRFLVLQFKETSSKIHLYDQLLGKWAGSLESNIEDVIFAAGGSVLITFDPALQRFELFEIPSLDKIGERWMLPDFKLKRMTMGSDNPSFVLICCHDKDEKNRHGLLQLPGFNFFPFPGGWPNHRDSMPNVWNYQIDVTPELDFLVMERNSPSYVALDKVGFRVDRISASGVPGNLSISEDGMLIASTSGKLYETPFSLIHEFEGPAFLSDTGTLVGVLGPDSTDFRVYDSKTLKPMFKLDLPWKAGPRMDFFLSDRLKRLTILNDQKSELFTTSFSEK